MNRFLIVLLVTIFFYACEQNPYKQGERIYQAKCANCHMEDGKGLGALIPPLAGTDFIIKNKEDLPCIITKGLNEPILVNGVIYNEAMEGVNLSAVEVNNVINYIYNTWGNEFGHVSIEETKRRLQQCK